MKFLTAPTLPSETVCRTLEMPNDKLWLGIFNKALLETVYEWNWKQVHETDLTPEESTAICWEILNQFWLTTNDCEEMVEAPFFDNEEDVDDEEELGEQTWYDEISDWIIAGFLAITFTPAAAIAYRATIPRIRLAIKTGNAGTILRVIFGSVDILYDTFAETPNIEFIELDYGVITEPLDEFELRIEHTGTHNPSATPTSDGYYAQIVRGDIRPVTTELRQNPLNPLELQQLGTDGEWSTWAELPPQTRVRQTILEPCTLDYSLDGGTVWSPFAGLQLCAPLIQTVIGTDGGIVTQVSTDGGETWQNTGVIYLDPIGDNPPPQSPQPSDARCNASRNAMLAYYNIAWTLAGMFDSLPDVEPYLAAAQFLPVLRDRLNFFIGSNVFSSIVSNVPLALAVTSYLTGVNASKAPEETTGYEIRLTTDFDNPIVQSAIQCAFYCAADGAGNINWSDALNELDALVDESVIQIGALNFISMLGAGGMAAAASARIGTFSADACSDCIECFECVSPITFDNPACYVLQSMVSGASAMSTLDESFGNPAPSAKCGYGSSGGFGGFGVKVSAILPIEQTIEAVTFDRYWWSTDNPTNVLAWGYRVYDASDNLTYEWYEPSYAGGTMNTWHLTDAAIPPSLAKRIEVYAGVTGVSDGAAWIDNIGWT